MLFIFIVAFGLNVVRFWEYRIVPCSDIYCDFCSVVAEPHLRLNVSYVFWYKLIMPAVGSLIVCSIIAGLNGAIVWKFRKAQQEHMAITQTEICGRSPEHHVTKVMMTVTLVFVLCYGLHFYMYFREVIVNLGKTAGTVPSKAKTA